MSNLFREDGYDASIIFNFDVEEGKEEEHEVVRQREDLLEGEYNLQFIQSEYLDNVNGQPAGKLFFKPVTYLANKPNEKLNGATILEKPKNFFNIDTLIFPFVYPKDRNGERIYDQGFVPNTMALSDLRSIISRLSGITNTAQLMKAFQIGVSPVPSDEMHIIRAYDPKQGELVERKVRGIMNAGALVEAYIQLLDDYVVLEKVNLEDIDPHKLFKCYVEVFPDTYVDNNGVEKSITRTRITKDPNGAWGVFRPLSAFDIDEFKKYQNAVLESQNGESVSIDEPEDDSTNAAELDAFFDGVNKSDDETPPF